LCIHRAGLCTTDFSSILVPQSSSEYLHLKRIFVYYKGRVHRSLIYSMYAERALSVQIVIGVAWTFFFLGGGGGARKFAYEFTFNTFKTILLIAL
jgi:hypothetical protein